MSNPFEVLAFQVFASVLQEGPKKSWDLRRAFYGEAYLDSSSKKNNNAYNRNRRNAVALDIIIKDGDFYVLGEQGDALVAWAEETDLDLSQVKSEARDQFERANGVS